MIYESPFNIFGYARFTNPMMGAMGGYDCIIAEIEAVNKREADLLFHIEVGPIPAKELWIGTWFSNFFSFTPPTQDKLDWIENGGYTPQPTI